MNISTNNGYYTLFVGVNNQYYFNLKAGNHEIILQSEGYVSKQGALNGIQSVQNNCSEDANYRRKTAQDDSPYFVLKASNGETIGKSEMYSSTQAMEIGITSVKVNGSSTTIKEHTEINKLGKPKETEIIVNGRSKIYEGKQISFTEVVKLAFPNYIESDRTIYTVTYSRGMADKPQGTLVKGQSVNVKHKMIFNVTQTDKS